jgi:hypothetical protein
LPNQPPAIDVRVHFAFDTPVNESNGTRGRGGKLLLSGSYCDGCPACPLIAQRIECPGTATDRAIAQRDPQPKPAAPIPAYRECAMLESLLECIRAIRSAE